MYKLAVKIVGHINAGMYKWKMRRFHKYVMPDMVKSLDDGNNVGTILNLVCDEREEEVYPIFEPMKKLGTFTPKDVERKLGELANVEE